MLFKNNFLIILLAFLLTGCFSESGETAYLRMIDRGIEDLKKGDIRMAESTFVRATKSAPTKPQGFYWLGRIRELDVASSEDEIELYKKAVSIDPGYFQAYSRLSFALIKSNKLQEARDYLMELAGSDVNNVKDTYSNIAYTYYLESNLEKAEEFYGKSLSIDAAYTFAINGLADVFIAKKDFSAAEGLLRKSLSIDNSYANRGVFVSLADMKEMQGNYREAINYWQKVLSFQNLPPGDMAEANKALERIKSKELAAPQP